MLLGWSTLHILWATSFIRVIIIYSRLIIISRPLSFTIIFLAFLLWLLGSLSSYTAGSRQDGSIQDMNSPLTNWETGGQFGFPAFRQIQTGFARAAIPSVFRISKNEVTNTQGFVRGKKNLSSMDSHCFKHAEIKNNNIKPPPILSCWYRTISTLNKF